MGLFDGFRRKHEDSTKDATAQKPAVEEATESPVAEADAGSQVETKTAEQVAAEIQAEVSAVVNQALAADEPVADEAEPAAANADTASATPAASEVSAPLKTIEEKEPATHAIGETKILAIINQKGGVGKSTTAINLAAALGVHNKAVLVVDLDPQGNTTSGFGVDKGQVQCDVYDVLIGEHQAEEAIIPDVSKGVDLLPATINLAGAEVELVNEMARENRLKSALGALRGKYDYIFIDCPPALGLLTVNALVASDKLLIPIQCEFYALEGVTKLLDSMKRVKNVLNPSLDTFGVLLTMYDGRTMLARQVAEEVRTFFGSRVFDTIIPRTVRLSEAPSFGQPITEYDPNGRGATAYMDLAKEVIQRG